MSRVPIGKVLLRNVIRHTDAHNKIQEESEMWKQRDLERQASSTHFPKHRGQMHCDRYLDDAEGSVQGRLEDRLSDRDEQEARYWTRKLYEFEANDPDRWGHSGFRELYPDQFQEKDCGESKHRRKKHKLTSEDGVGKNSKKPLKKKKKKKERKRRKPEGSGSESCSDAEDILSRKRRRKTGKNKHRKKENKSKERTEDGTTEGSCSETRMKTQKKRDCPEMNTLTEPQRKKRKNWRVGKDEKSEDSSDG